MLSLQKMDAKTLPMFPKKFLIWKG